MAFLGFMIRRYYIFFNEEFLICISLVLIYLLIALSLKLKASILLFVQIKKIHVLFKCVFIINHYISNVMDNVMQKCKVFFICVGRPFFRLATYIRKFNIIEEYDFLYILLPITYGKLNIESEV